MADPEPREAKTLAHSRQNRQGNLETRTSVMTQILELLRKCRAGGKTGSIRGHQDT